MAQACLHGHGVSRTQRLSSPTLLSQDRKFCSSDNKLRKQVSFALSAAKNLGIFTKGFNSCIKIILRTCSDVF